MDGQLPLKRPPGRVPKSVKKGKRKASKATYAAMLAAATPVVMANRGIQYRSGEPEYVLFEFPYFVKFAPTFPKGIIVERTPATNVYKVNAVKLLNWLHANGHSPYDAATLVKETKQFEYLTKGIDRMFDI